MPSEWLAGNNKRLTQLRRELVPDWIWQVTWLRHLPRYFRSILWSECDRSKARVLMDMLYIFLKLKSVPEHYGPYRLWERPRSEWALYYGSPYTPIQRARLAKRVYPLEFEILYNDKVVGAQLCKALSVRQPDIYATLEPQGPWRQKLASVLDSKANDRVMLKPVFGRSGIGIMLAEQNKGEVIVQTRDARIPLAQYQLDWPVFVQELIRQDSRIAAIWDSSVNTIRVITLQTQASEVLILGCALRFGVGKSFVDNWSAGGVAVGVHTDTGRLRKYGYDAQGNRYAQHPSSQFTFENFEIPQWQNILETARQVQREIAFSKVVGVDICLDQNGKPVLIEINGLPDFVFIEQMNGPLLADKQILQAFAEYDLLVSTAQKNLASANSSAKRQAQAEQQ